MSRLLSRTGHTLRLWTGPSLIFRCCPEKLLKVGPRAYLLRCGRFEQIERYTPSSEARDWSWEVFPTRAAPALTFQNNPYA